MKKRLKTVSILIAVNILLILVNGFLVYKSFFDPDVKIVYLKLPDERVDYCIDRIGVLESNFLRMFDVYYQQNYRKLTSKQKGKLIAIKYCYSIDKAKVYYKNLMDKYGIGGYDE